MDLDEFWKLIERTHQESGGDPEKQCSQLIAILVDMSLKAIFDYQRIQDELEDRAYRRDLKHFNIETDGIFDVGKGFFTCLALTDTAGQAGHVRHPEAVLTGINQYVSHRRNLVYQYIS